MYQITYLNKQGVQRTTKAKTKPVAERLASFLKRRGATNIHIKE